MPAGWHVDGANGLETASPYTSHGSPIFRLLWARYTSSQHYRAWDVHCITYGHCQFIAIRLHVYINKCHKYSQHTVACEFNLFTLVACAYMLTLPVIPVTMLRLKPLGKVIVHPLFQNTPRHETIEYWHSWEDMMEHWTKGAIRYQRGLRYFQLLMLGEVGQLLGLTISSSIHWTLHLKASHFDMDSGRIICSPKG